MRGWFQVVIRTAGAWAAPANPPVSVQFDGEGLLWCSNGPGAESSEGHMGNVGVLAETAAEPKSTAAVLVKGES